MYLRCLRETRSPSGRLSAKDGRPSEDPTKLGRAGVNSVRVRVRFIELEQQAAIRHNSIISFFRAFLPSSPRYDGTRRPRDTQAPHVYQPAAAEDSPPHPSRREDRFSLSLSFSCQVPRIPHSGEIENSKSQIPNISRAERGTREWNIFREVATGRVVIEDVAACRMPALSHKDRDNNSRGTCWRYKCGCAHM